MTIHSCSICDNKRYIMSDRLDDYGNQIQAIERCDNCASEVLTDQQAAILARYDGYQVSEVYPFRINWVQE